VIAINVSQLLKQPPGTTRDFDFSDWLAELRPEFELASPVEGHAHLLRTSRGIYVFGRYQASVRQVCGRCLSPTIIEIQGGSEDEFVPTVDVLSGHALAEQPESEELAIDDRHVLSLSEVVRQDLLTRLPLQALCEPNCPGLCPECGRELRAGGCACGDPTEASSPFARLAELFPSHGSQRSSD
jgi:uncharacterized protein